MPKVKPTRADRFGLVKPTIDVHTLGIRAIEHILQECGYSVVVGDSAASEAFGRPEEPSRQAAIEEWIRGNRITFLGFSYRLDPAQGAALVGRLVWVLKQRRLLAEQGGPLRGLYFAGLPATCDALERQIPELDGVFRGDESPAEALATLGIDPGVMPQHMAEGVSYDEARMSFGRELIRKGDYLNVRPVDRNGYEGFGTREDTLARRIEHGARNRLPPLMRAHVGAYGPDRAAAVQLFLEWTGRLAGSGLLDILSIGTSQLTQSRFGEDWGGMANGGGVPINSPAEFAAVWLAARPMLVRTYAGTKNIPALARMYEETLSMAWHTLSLWWFCRMDGRGPYAVRENLERHVETIKYVASVGKPFEPNVPHHFAFRGADDVSCVVSAALAARTAKAHGIRHLVLQDMLNTPKYTWGVQDLAKSRAMLSLARELEDGSFRVSLQPRVGLDYFSHDLEKAKAQLAAVTALMDDIEPRDAGSPPIIHVVSYSEASHLADPPVVEESIRITRAALDAYRGLRARGEVDDMTEHADVVWRTEELRREARTVLQTIEARVPSPYSAEGLYRVFASGFLAVPHLWECRDEFRQAVRWQTRPVRGGVKIVDDQGRPIPAAARMRLLEEELVHAAP